MAYFHVKGADVHLLNAIRRTVLSDLPSFAIEDVSFYENTSPLFNEYIAHRLAMIPLTFDENASPDVKITLSIEATGPSIVYSKDFKSTDDKITPATQHIPIMTLMENQTLRLEAVAILGSPSQHAKFQNSHCSYGYFPELKVKGKITDALQFLPKGSVDERGKILQPEKLDIGHLNDSVSVEAKEGEFILLIESYNGEDPSDVLRRTLKLIKEKITALKTELK